MKFFLGLLFLVSNMAFSNELMVKVSLSPAGSFEAKTAKLKGDVKVAGDKMTAEQLWIKVEELKTGIDLRDQHFHKHLSFEKYPKITMTKVEAQGGTGKGLISINDVKKDITFKYKKISDKKIEAVFELIPSQFNLKKAEYMGIGVEDKVVIVATLDI